MAGRRRWATAAAAAMVAIPGVVLAAVALSRTNEPRAADIVVATSTSTSTVTAAALSSPSATPIRFAGILDGGAMSEDEWQARKDRLPIAVMVDNSPFAYPHSGLDHADLVYEAFVEGAITRFMAVYWRRDSELIEPVRSARTPFVIWVDELGALYAHAGGAVTDNDANAMGQIAEWQIKDLNAFGTPADSKYYRDSERYAPYNLVTGTGPLREAAEGHGYKGPPALAPWLFKADGEGTTRYPRAGGIEVEFEARRSSWQVVQWHWDPTLKAYLRFQHGGPHRDAVTKEQLRFTSVVAMRVPWEVVDDSGHVLLQQFGEGPAQVFLDGRVIEGTWKKVDRKSRTRFYDASGQEIAFNRGPIFIEVLGPESIVTVVPEPGDLPPLPPYIPPEPSALPSGEPGDEATPQPGPAASPSPSLSASPSPSASVSPSRSPSPSATGAPGSPSPSAPATTTPPATAVTPSPAGPPASPSAAKTP